jgi:hypothetical protein
VILDEFKVSGHFIFIDRPYRSEKMLVGIRKSTITPVPADTAGLDTAALKNLKNRFAFIPKPTVNRQT